MPELPEVETVRRGLEPAMSGRRIVAAAAFRPDLRFPFPAGFAERLAGARVDQVARRAKYLILRLDTGWSLIAHLGMTGRFTILDGRGGAETPGLYHRAAPTAHVHVRFDLDDGGRIEFSDPRRFGYMDLVATGELAGHPYFLGMGPEPLEPGFDAAYLETRLKGRSQAIKAALLDQRLVAGLGNIYVCEALHRAGVSPKRKAGAIGAARAARLATAVRDVLEEAIAAGGSTLRDYAAADGALGYFQHAFRVYGREGEVCACGGEIRRFVQHGRSTFHCPACQR